MVTCSRICVSLQNSSVSQDLVRGAEHLSDLLSKTLTSDTTEATKTMENIGEQLNNLSQIYLPSFYVVIKAERVSSNNTDEGYVFPDDDDDLMDYNGGTVQLMIPSGLVQDISKQKSSVLNCIHMYVATQLQQHMPCNTNF